MRYMLPNKLCTAMHWWNLWHFRYMIVLKLVQQILLKYDEGNMYPACQAIKTTRARRNVWIFNVSLWKCVPWISDSTYGLSPLGCSSNKDTWNFTNSFLMNSLKEGFRELLVLLPQWIQVAIEQKELLLLLCRRIKKQYISFSAQNSLDPKISHFPSSFTTKESCWPLSCFAPQWKLLLSPHRWPLAIAEELCWGIITPHSQLTRFRMKCLSGSYLEALTKRTSANSFTSISSSCSMAGTVWK